MQDKKALPKMPLGSKRHTYLAYDMAIRALESVDGKIPYPYPGARLKLARKLRASLKALQEGGYVWR
jgi:hypothetical protein